MDLIRLQKPKITSPLCYVTCIGYRLVQGLTLSSACTCTWH